MVQKHKLAIDLIKQQINQSITPTAKLIAVSKFFPTEDIISVYEHGITNFGENFPQEFVQKAQQLKSLNITWHFIGNIQSNKTKLIAEHASYVHSLTKENHAVRLNNQRPQDMAKLKVLIEINISQESNKHGLTNIEDVIQLASAINKLPNLELVGLMGMASNTTNVTILNQQFGSIVSMANELRKSGYNISELSIGTSNDYLTALDNHSTMIRVGSKIFGERNYDN